MSLAIAAAGDPWAMCRHRKRVALGGQAWRCSRACGLRCRRRSHAPKRPAGHLDLLLDGLGHVDGPQLFEAYHGVEPPTEPLHHALVRFNWQWPVRRLQTSLAGVNYLGRRVASRRNVARGLVVVVRLFGCSAIHSQEPPRRGRRRPPVGAMYSWFNPLSAASAVRCRAVRCPRVRPARRERVVSMPYDLLGAERPARRRRRRFLCRRFRFQPG